MWIGRQVNHRTVRQLYGIQEGTICWGLSEPQTRHLAAEKQSLHYLRSAPELIWQSHTAQRAEELFRGQLVVVHHVLGDRQLPLQLLLHDEVHLRRASVRHTRPPTSPVRMHHDEPVCLLVVAPQHHHSEAVIAAEDVHQTDSPGSSSSSMRSSWVGMFLDALTTG